MNKRALLGVMLSGVLLLSGCGANRGADQAATQGANQGVDNGVDQEVKAVIDAIDGLGEIEVSDIDGIKQARSLYDALTDDQKGQVSNYAALEEAVKQLPTLEKQFAIENDKTAPTFAGLEDGATIEVKGGVEFNLDEYLGEKLKVTDDVTEGQLDYHIDCESDAYDSATGSFDTQSAAEYPVTLVAKDEAGNEGKLGLVVKVVPIRVTKDDPTPLIYEGEYGTIRVKGFVHDTRYEIPAYYLDLEVANSSDKTIVAYLFSSYTAINNQQVGAYYVDNSIPSGYTGVMECEIHDSDIPDGIGEYSSIESLVGIAEAGSGSALYRIPISLDVNISE